MARTSSLQTRATGSTKRLIISLWSITSRVSSKLRPEMSQARVAPRQLLTAISNKATWFRHKKRGIQNEKEFRMDGSDGEFGLWQRSILMGEKCEPLDFSGAIYYDCSGKQLEEVPVRSPRVSPLPSYLYKSAARRDSSVTCG